MQFLLRLISFIVLSSSTRVGLASSLDIWERQAGEYGDGGEVERGKVVSLDLGIIKTKERKLNDLQYRRENTYQAFPLAEIIAKARTLFQRGDMAILHFKNGMTIPWTDQRKNEHLFLATKIKDDKAWATTFPEVNKFHDYYKDPRPIKFSGNKVVLSVSALKLPEPDEALPFSPWLHTDSLLGIEFVQMNAYENQFDYGENVAEGQAVFLSRCLYCHGVRRIGATFGWDFVHPTPIYLKRQKTDLFYHVKYPKADALRRGLMMPNQIDFTEKNASDLWDFMKAAANAKHTKAYKAKP